MIKKIANLMRRRVIEKLKKDYISNKLKKRQGKCKKCGQCCKGCLHLSEDNLCKTYDNRPYYCHVNFPIDKFDQKCFNVKDCGYEFKSKN